MVGVHRPERRGPDDGTRRADRERSSRFHPHGPVVGLVQLNSPHYDAAAETLEAALDAHGLKLATRVSVQKDESQFQHVWSAMQTARVNVIVLYAHVNLFIKMVNQRPMLYRPAFASIAAEFAVNEAASAAPGLTLVSLHDPSPVYDPNDEASPWRDEIEEFHRVFSEYSSQQDPPRNDIDWMFYLRAKQVHRFLDSLDRETTPERIRSAMSSYVETPDQAFPSCALDFATERQVGQHAWHVFRSTDGRWEQAATCASADPGHPVDISPPVLACGAAVQVSRHVVCTASDPGSGVGAWTLDAVDAAGSSRTWKGDGGCASDVTIGADLPIGLHDVRVGVRNCASGYARAHATVVSAG